MRILHIISGLGPGGAEHMLLRLVEASPGTEHVVFSLAGRGSLSAQLRQAGAVLANDADRPSLPRIIAALVRCTVLCRPQIIQGWMYHGNLAASLAARLAPRAALFWNIRQTLALTQFTKRSTRLIVRVLATLSRGPRAILYNSEQGAVDHEAVGFDRSRRLVLPNGFNTTLFAPNLDHRRAIRTELGAQAEDILVGLVARFDAWKNHAGFFQMADRLLADDPRLRYVLAGKGIDWTNDALVALIPGTLPRGRLALLGDRRDVAAIDAALDIAVNVSHGEGFPNAVGEAMACGVPCVVTPVGASVELVGGCGAVAMSTSIADLVAAVRSIVELPRENRQTLGAAARRRILKHFSIDAVLSMYVALYERALEYPGLEPVFAARSDRLAELTTARSQSCDFSAR